MSVVEYSVEHHLIHGKAEAKGSEEDDKKYGEEPFNPLDVDEMGILYYKELLCIKLFGTKSNPNDKYNKKLTL